MELYQLKSFIAVAEEEHLTRASERLRVSQPSVSSHIKALEEEFGIRLFIRTPKGMLLTNEGKIIKTQVEKTLEALQSLQEKANHLKRNITGVARIGLNLDLQYLKALALLRNVQENFPNIELHYSQRHSQEAGEMIRNGKLDAAFVFGNASNSDLESRWLGKIGIVIVGPYEWGHRLKELDREEFCKLPWIMTDERCPFNDITRKFFEPLGRYPEKSVVVDSSAEIMRMVVSNAGLGLMSVDEANEAQRQKQLVVLSDSVAELDLYFLFSKKRAAEPMLFSLVEMVCDLWANARIDTVRQVQT